MVGGVFFTSIVRMDELRTSPVYAVHVYVEDTKNILRLGIPATVAIDLQ